MGSQPGYIIEHRTGRLALRAAELKKMTDECRICPRDCAVDRRSGEKGFCRAGEEARVSSFSPHFGEESPLVGRSGSGTIFFAHCPLRCSFCQNEDISLRGLGSPVSAKKLAGIMLTLQEMGCANINLVTPTHFTPRIVTALDLVAGAGLRLPIVYNCGGYEKVETLKLLDGLIDIYMPDFKFGRSAPAAKYARAPDYPEVARAAITEMHRQVGDLQLGPDGLARRGLLVRHLVLPRGLAGTEEVVEFLAGLSKETYLNVMAQYHPCGPGGQEPPLDRRTTGREFGAAVETALAAGLNRLDRRPRLGRHLFRGDS